MCCLVATHSYFLLFVIYLMLNVPISICPSILSPPVFLFMSLFFGWIFTSSQTLASSSRITIWSNSRPFLSVSLYFCLCVCAHVFCPLSVFPRCQQPSVWPRLPLSVALLWDQLPLFEWVWTKFSTRSHLVHPASIESPPWPLFLTCCLPKQHRPVSQPVSQPVTALT